MSIDRMELLAKQIEATLEAQVRWEAVGENGRYRLAVVSSRFATMAPLARQDAVWEVVGSVLDRNDRAFGISLIYTYAPAEVAEEAVV